MRNLVFTVLSLGLAGSLYYNHKLSSDNQQKTQLLADQAQQLQQVSEELKKEHRKNMSEVEAEQEVVDGLNQSLIAQKQVLDSSEQRLNSARNRGGGVQDFQHLNEDLRAQQDGLTELERQLAVTKTKQTQLGSEGKQTQSQEKWNQLQDNDAIAGQIRAQQLQINQTNDQLAQLKKQRRNFDAQEKIPMVEAQLRDQKTALQVLNEQKQNYAQQWNSQRGLSQIQVEAQQSTLHVTESQLRDQIQSQKIAVQRAQRSLSEAKNNQTSQRDNLGLLEKDFQAQKIKYQEIQNQLLENQKKLEELKNG